MNGGQQRYWNETTQRWEDTAGGTAPVTPPPPPRPAATPPPPRPAAAPEAPAGEHAGHPAGASAPVPPPTHGAWSAPEPPRTGAWSASEPPRTGAWPQPGHPPVPPPARTGRPSRRLVWSVLGGAGAAGAVAALVLTLVVPGDDGTDDRGGHAAGPAGTSASAGHSTPEPSALRTDEPEASAEAPATPSATAPGLPADYELHADPEGFTVARPVGWVRETVPSKYGIDVVNYRSSDGERRLQVYQVEEASPEASFELFLSDGTPKAEGFRKISLETLDDGDFTGSRLEYLVDSVRGEPDVGTWHVVDERFVAADGEVYAIAAYGADADGREDERELLRTALGHFCPPHTACGTGTDSL
ncbi:hypothetical protein [Streptomyces sp. M92]|uniref:hypothetical protein n=1 Tax=Streptomyces sp. M92 TaxID=2944250 RepID=UPI00234BD3CB|nr:hypothetical protein [Streptomyces sp. M92]